MKVLDLFSGIGGFSLGLERAGMETVAFCEIDPDCREVLQYHWKNVPIFENVKELSFSKDGKTLFYKDESHFDININLVCGGYPCQGHSVAGNKKGFQHEKSKLWREFHRLTLELMPEYCIIENSPNLRNTGLEIILQAFDEIGYNAELSIISAYSIGSPHQRERLYIVLWRKDLSHPDAFRLFRSDPQKEKIQSSWWTKRRFKRDSLFKKISKIESPICEFVDGISGGLDIDQVETSLKQLGNAVVPQIPELIGKALMNYDSK